MEVEEEALRAMDVTADTDGGASLEVRPMREQHPWKLT